MEGVTEKVWAIILASGLSKRMGKPKLLLPFKEKTLLSHVLDQCKQSNVNGIVVVVHPKIDGLVQEAEKGGADIVILNRKADEGMSTSFIAGIEALPKEADAAIFLLGDQPLMSVNEINAVITDSSKQTHLIYQAAYYGKKGHPVLFKREIFPELLKVKGDEGGRSVLKKYANFVSYTEMNRPEIQDIDTPEQYEALLAGKTC
ncbi:nucleotidyltransferase family protein [Bacillus sp. B15-48]|uniref:nucleotidyltransferase family protein n=1 Tax=Bacillus sp. B15-48 TaxID=1548601 RepID=UPI00193F8C4C|nr:nucleotidyltransferase family protein [Bacillus sp. B15-48]MBM4763647.1 NTP transferase domain-containing protein [Bacillus sp. B15-48]